jgi:hypothetical protein
VSAPALAVMARRQQLRANISAALQSGVRALLGSGNVTLSAAAAALLRNITAADVLVLEPAADGDAAAVAVPWRVILPMTGVDAGGESVQPSLAALLRTADGVAVAAEIALLVKAAVEAACAGTTGAGDASLLGACPADQQPLAVWNPSSQLAASRAGGGSGSNANTGGGAGAGTPLIGGSAAGGAALLLAAAAIAFVAVRRKRRANAVRKASQRLTLAGEARPIRLGSGGQLLDVLHAEDDGAVEKAAAADSSAAAMHPSMNHAVSSRPRAASRRYLLRGASSARVGVAPEQSLEPTGKADGAVVESQSSPPGADAAAVANPLLKPEDPDAAAEAAAAMPTSERPCAATVAAAAIPAVLPLASAETARRPNRNRTPLVSPVSEADVEGVTGKAAPAPHALPHSIPTAPDADVAMLGVANAASTHASAIAAASSGRTPALSPPRDAVAAAGLSTATPRAAGMEGGGPVDAKSHSVVKRAASIKLFKAAALAAVATAGPTPAAAAAAGGGPSKGLRSAARVQSGWSQRNVLASGTAASVSGGTAADGPRMRVDLSRPTEQVLATARLEPHASAVPVPTVAGPGPARVPAAAEQAASRGFAEQFAETAGLQLHDMSTRDLLRVRETESADVLTRTTAAPEPGRLQSSVRHLSMRTLQPAAGPDAGTGTAAAGSSDCAAVPVASGRLRPKPSAARLVSPAQALVSDPSGVSELPATGDA